MSSKQSNPKMFCQTPTPGKKATLIDQWKYDAVRNAIRKVVPRNKAGIPFEDLPELVEQALGEEDRARLGSVPWYTTTVKLHMETLGEIERVPGVSPQHLRRGKATPPGQ